MKKITLTIASLLVASVGFAQSQMTENPTVQIETNRAAGNTVATATQVGELPFTDPAVDIPGGTQEEGQIGCNFNVPSVDYKFRVITAGDITVTVDNVSGLSEPVFYLAPDLEVTDPTVLEAALADGTGGGDCQPAGDTFGDGTRTMTGVEGQAYYVLVANEAASDIIISGDAVLEPELSVGSNELSQVSIFPNPASDVINIQAPASVEVNSVAIYDVLGKKSNVSLVNGQINVANLAKGVYILNIETNAGTLTEKVVKN